jgi:hypothetical protein
MTTEPEMTADKIVEATGWSRLPNFNPKDVWVDGGF